MARVTLASCRERLSAAIRLLSADQQDTPAAEGSAAGDPPEADAAGQSGSAAILRDFQSAERAYDDLMVNISHDVKTSLTVIRGHAQMMARAIRRGDEVDREALLAALTIIDSRTVQIDRELEGWIDDGTRSG